MDNSSITTKTRTSTKTLVGWALVAAAIVAGVLIARRTVWKVQMVQTGPGPLPAQMGGPGPLPSP